jgi:hypothetical protein
MGAVHQDAEIVEPVPAVESVSPDEEDDEEAEPLVVDGTSDEAPKRRPPIKIIEDEGMNIWHLAKLHLDRINKHDTQREEAMNECIEYCKNRMNKKPPATTSCWSMAQDFIATLKPLSAWEERQALCDVKDAMINRLHELDKLKGKEKPGIVGTK